MYGLFVPLFVLVGGINNSNRRSEFKVDELQKVDELASLLFCSCMTSRYNDQLCNSGLLFT